MSKADERSKRRQEALLEKAKHEADVARIRKEKERILNEFYDSLNRVKDVMTAQELAVAKEALKAAGMEVQEREREQQAVEKAKKEQQEAAERAEREAARAQREAERRQEEHRRHVQEVTCMDLPMDWVNAYAVDPRAHQPVDSIADGLLRSLEQLGRVDIEFIAELTGDTCRTVIETLKGSIYQNPMLWGECFYKGWETADEYLSGNLAKKMEEASHANHVYHGYFEANVQALQTLIQPDIDPKNIYISLGSPWVPTDVIDEFILHLVGETRQTLSELTGVQYDVRHDEITGMWEIPNKTRFRKCEQHGKYMDLNYSVWGTKRMDMLCLLENTLNMKTLTVHDTVDAEGKVRILNQPETVKLLDKQDQMKEEFVRWVWSDEMRTKRLQQAYCSRYGNIRRRVYDGSFLTFPGMNPDIQLYDYQKNSVARILMAPNTLLAHDVGSGKTFVMIAAGMELRRLGKSRKNLYVVPNNIIGQWHELFLEMYPNAKLLVVDSHNFHMKKRTETLKKIADEDFDAILMTYSCFDMLSLSNRYYKHLYDEQLQLAKRASQSFYSDKKMNRRYKVINDLLEKLKELSPKSVCDIAFDELGINTLFVDEAHNYKNVPIETRITRVLGGGSGGSEKCKGMMDKVHCVQRQNNGGRVIMATGTPITNSITDLFVLQKYLQEGELEFLGLHNFDSWAGMFAQKITDFEIDVDTNNFHLTTRFSRFCNVPELTAILSSIADFHKVDRQAGLPAFEGYTDSQREGSDEFKAYLHDISNRADDVRHKRVSRVEDNLLKITSDGRKAALDMRLIDLAFGLEPESKVMRCAENVMQVYEQTRDFRGVQLVFCDSSTPKPGFNLYTELKNLLVAMGMPKHQVVFVHDAANEAQREELFRRMRNGEIAVMVGSTFKMGIGVNVQQRLKAIHHLDVPWRPADMVQREGRILRQGNECDGVQIYRYITKGSFDAYSWQLLETKQRFISQILSGEVVEREGRDVDEAVLNYAEVKALAIGNPLIKKRVEVCNQLDKQMLLQREYVEERRRKEEELRGLPDKIRRLEQRIADCELDIADSAADPTDYDAIGYLEQKAMRERIWQAVQLHQNLPTDVEIMTYCGFRLIVPAHMQPRPVSAKWLTDDADAEAVENDGEAISTSKEVPYILVKGHGGYYLYLQSESGISKRLNNFLRPSVRNVLDKETKEVLDSKAVMSGLEQRLIRFRETLEGYHTRVQVLTDALTQKGEFAAEIERLQNELDYIDEQLGVNAA